jgi:hypothetical protein
MYLLYDVCDFKKIQNQAKKNSTSEKKYHASRIIPHFTNLI